MSEFDIGVVQNNATYLGTLNSTDLTDIYKLNLTTGGAFNVSLSGLTDNADLFLLNSNNQIIQSSTLSDNSSETLSFQNLSAGIYSLQITSAAGPTDYLLGIQTPQTSTVEIDPLTGLPLTDNQLPTHPNFETGIFRVGETGIVNINYLYDGGRFAGDFGLFNLAGMEAFTPGSTNYIKEAARRALTNSSLGYTVISDTIEAAKFSGVVTPTETDFNTGTYTGIKTFGLNPGDTFGFILTPQDSLEAIFNKPGLGGGRKALFSMGTPNANDTFYQGQITRVTDNNTGFVLEDMPVLNPRGNTDYNDLIFQIQGTIGIAPSLTDYVYDGRDWRSTPTGQQIVNFINTADTIPPTLQAALANDTGENNTDKITFDPTISGIVTDSSKIFSLRARFNNTSVGTYTDIVSLINPDGTFSLNRQQLETIYGQALPEGEHTLYLQAIDKYGAVSNTFTLAFTLEPEVIPVTDIGGIYQFNGQVINSTLRPRQSQQFTFKLRNSEITSTASDTVLISMSVAALSGSNFQPAVPALQGLTPLFSQNNTNNSYALFAFNTAGQNTINLTGLNSTDVLAERLYNGQYGLQLTVAGDINLDEKVDATDAQLLNQALGITSNNPGYSLNLDINRDGVINNSDLELLNQNLGFVANTPAVITPSNILTHQELETTIDLGKFVSDADNDALAYSISNPVNGTLETLNDGQTVVFKPASNFAGVGSFEISVDDGYYKASETININVSDAPLINLEIIKSKKQLNVGETISLEVQGDFADAEDVVLPDSYLTYATENAAIAQISASGDVTASSEGTTILSVKRNNISAVTAIRAGQLKTPQNQSELNIAIAELYGLDSYPDAVTLPVGGTRQLLVGLNEVQESPDLKGAASGTRYFVSDSNILNVSVDGQITALKEGFATVTIIHGAAEEIIPVRVGAEVTGPAIVGADGGIVKADDGSAVMIAPGALDENTTVSLTALSQAQLSLPIPEGFQFAGAFNLEFSENALNVPAQLAIPAPAGMQAGTEVYFMRKGALPDETGTWNPIWLQEESGIVGDDGMIRTSSPPYPGVIRPGEYMVAYADITGSATLVKGQLTLNYNFPLAFFGIIDPRGDIGQLIEPENFVTIPAFTVTYDISSVKVIAIPKVGLPVITEVGVQRSTDGLATFETALNMPAPVNNDPTEPPILQKASLQFNDEFNNPFPGGEPVLFLTGSNVLVNTGFGTKGNQWSDLSVKFSVGNKIYESTIISSLSQILGNNEFKVAVKVPKTVALGISKITLERKQDQLIEQNDILPVYEEIQLESNSIRLEEPPEYVFAALQRADKIAVLEASNPKSVVENANSQALRKAFIPVGTDDMIDRPRRIAVTNDSTRVYVALENSGRIALVDPMVLQQVDTQTENVGINPINLPSGARPVSIVINSSDEIAYIADGVNSNIYVLDINPFSATYHQVIQTIVLNNPVASGFRQMAINSDGRKLFVTALNGYIYVVNIDPEDRQSNSNPNLRKWHEQIGQVLTRSGADGVTATTDALKVTFTNGNTTTDGNGFGVLEFSDDPVNFTANISYINLSLGSEQDYFDVNEGVAVTLTRDLKYAFVAGRNRNGSINQTDRRMGGNIGIIKDPLTNPQVVAATRPIPGALTADVVLSSDNKYLYASYPTLSGSGGVYVFDVEEIVNTLNNPSNFQIDHLDRGVKSPYFSPTTARQATVSDLARVPIDDINPNISIAADFGIVQGDWASYQFNYGVVDAQKAPIPTGFPFGLAAAGGDKLDLIGPVGNVSETDNPLTPTFEWDFEELSSEDIKEVNLFVSTFDEGSGLLPWDEVVDLSNPNENEFLFNQGLDKSQQFDLLTRDWNVSFYRRSNDFNPNRVLTATWQRDEDGIGKWTLDGGLTWIEGSNTRFTLPTNRTLSAGQQYNWAVEAWTNNGKRSIDFGEFWTPLPAAMNGENTFSSVTLLTHGFKPPFFSQSGIPNEFYQLADNIVEAGVNDDGLIMKYDSLTGYWIPVDKKGRILGDFPSAFNPANDPEYLSNLKSYITPYLQGNKPLALLSDWSKNNESVVPDSGFTEAAGDAIFASLVQLDQLLLEESSNSKQGAVFNSPMHFIGFSRGAVVNSEIIQRLGIYYPEAGGKENTGVRDLQMTTLDPHDFDQPGLNVVTKNFGDFREPKVQVWENVTFADNYYQTVPNLLGGTVTPAGRNIPNLPATELGKTAPGLMLPRQGFRGENPNPNSPLLGEPDFSVFLGTNKDNPDYSNSRAGFTRETDPALVIAGRGATHGRVLNWYAGTTNLFPTHFPFSEEDDANAIFRRRGDGYYEHLFDKEFSFGEGVNQPPRVSPWYTPEHKGANFIHEADYAPAEGIGTGWFYSVLGGGKELRPKTFVPRVPVDFDNTYDARMRGDFAVPTLFNGNFDAGFNLQGLNRTLWSDKIAGWFFHNGETSNSLSTSNLVDVNQLSATEVPALSAELDRIGVDRTQPNYALKLQASQSITHNRFVVPEWGNLRFDIHIPEAELGEGKRLLVTLEAADGSQAGVSSSINLTRAERTRSSYLADTQKIDYGIKGFETFLVEVPDNLRGQAATLKFEVVGGGTVYLDNVFFKSQHLLFGNPSDARNTTDQAIADKNNYLLEKAQFATAYDDSSKTPQWVSWQLNKKWLGDTPRASSLFIEDPSIPESWGRVVNEDYEDSDYFRGHLLPSSGRTNSEKDNIATFLLTNVVPQHYDNNNLFLGETPNQPAWTSFDGFLQQITQSNPITENPGELYVVAGGYGSNPNSQRYNHYSRPETLTAPEILISKGINIPGWTWKVVLDLEQPGLTPPNVTVTNAATYGILTPNEVEPAHVPTNPDGTVGNNGDFSTPVAHPFNSLLGLSLPDIPNKTAWRNWQTWKLTINQIEDLTGLDFFSNLPDEVEEILESEG